MKKGYKMSDTRNMAKEQLPEPTLRRLPWYLAYVKLLESQCVSHVSSTQIAKEINVDPSQIAKDLSFLSVKGKTRIGYEVHTLVKELTDFLGFKHKHNAFMIGVGSLGDALIRDVGLAQYGLNIVAGFDVDDQVVARSDYGVPIYNMSELARRQKEYGVSIGILAVPVEQAQIAANVMIESGLKAIWNFTPFRIKTPAHIVIQNTSIYAHLAVMYYRMDEMCAKYK